jgi:hypothetical protein
MFFSSLSLQKSVRMMLNKLTVRMYVPVISRPLSLLILYCMQIDVYSTNSEMMEYPLSTLSDPI